MKKRCVTEDDAKNNSARRFRYRADDTSDISEEVLFLIRYPCRIIDNRGWNRFDTAYRHGAVDASVQLRVPSKHYTQKALSLIAPT